MKNIKLFIWDFDGTLLDTYPNITRYLKQALNDFGKDADQTEILEKMMTTIPYSIRYYSELYDLPELAAHYRAYYAEEKNDPIRVFPGIPEVLRRVQEIGAANYIFTNRGMQASHCGGFSYCGVRALGRGRFSAGSTWGP